MAMVNMEMVPISDEEEGRHTVIFGIARQPVTPVDPASVQVELAEEVLRGSGEQFDGMEAYVAAVRRRVPPQPAIDICLRKFSYTVQVPLSDKRRYAIPGIVSGLRDNLTSSCCIKKRPLEVLKDVDLFLETGKSYLLMGPPTCGTSSLLKALNDRLPSHSLHGELSCANRPLSSYNWRHMSSYCGQLDVQHAMLTVNETFQFALDCQFGPRNWGSHEGLQDVDEYLKSKVRLFTYLLGLGNCRDTIIGNESVRGCSGGEKKRVSIGESILGPARVLLMDKISTGLDSAVTFDIMHFLAHWTREMEGILVCHLTQPDPAVIDLFDAVILMDSGHVIFNGPPSAILPHFRAFHYDLPVGRDLGSFISEMGKFGGREDYRTDPALPPVKTDEFVAAYETSESFKSSMKRFDALPMHSSSSSTGKVKLHVPSPAGAKGKTQAADPGATYSRRLFEDSFPHSFMYSLWVLCIRQARLTLRNRSYMLSRQLNNFVVSLILGWIFFNPSNFMVRVGMIVQTMLSSVISGNSSIMTLFKQKNVMYKQMRQGYFGAFQFVMAQNIADYILMLFDTLTFGTIIYALGGMSWEDYGTRYLMFLATVFCLLMAYNAWTRMFAMILHQLSTLQAIFPFIMFIMNNFCGFAITVNKIMKPLLFVYYISPMNYGLRILATNEFMSPKYQSIYPGSTMTEGQVYLSQYELPLTDKYNGYYILILIGEHILFSLVQVIVLMYIFYEPYPAGVSVDKSKLLPVITDEEQEAQLSRASTSMQELPFRPACFTFENVNYFVPVVDRQTKQTKEKQLLCNVSGFVKPCGMIALMGASGAGKTTLLDVLSRRKTQGRIEGRFLINGAPYTLNDLCRISGYVEQDDTLPATETVREALMFSARLRIGSDSKDSTIEKFVDEMIELLELHEYQNLMIGRPGSGLPVGIRKLVMVGIELVANPSILFLDEPTTGLDSYGALLVCRVLQRIAATGRSIICTIHQPSTEVFCMFREILLLERGGRIVFFGESCSGKQMIEYFNSVPGVKPFEDGTNPATWMLDTIGAGVASQQTVRFSDHFVKTEQYSSGITELRLLAEDRSNPINLPQTYASSLWRQCVILSNRTFRMAYRRLDYNLKRFQIAFLMALILGLVFFQVKGTDQAGAQSKFGAIFVSTLFLGLNNIFGNIPVLIDNRLTFYREVSMRTYSPMAQLFALTVMELVYTTLLTLMFQVISYFMVGMRLEFTTFLYHVFMNVLWILFCVYCGQLMVYIVPTVEVGALVTNVVLLIWNVIAGFAIPYPNLKYPWKAIYWVDPTMFVTQGILSNQFENDYSMIYNVPVGNSQLRNFTAREYYEVISGVRYSQKWWDIFAILVFIVFFRLLTGVAMVYVRYISR